MKRSVQALFRLGKAFSKSPRMLAKAASSVLETEKSTDPMIFSQAVDAVKQSVTAIKYTRNYVESSPPAKSFPAPPPNPLWDYFQAHTTGKGIFKWEHYFDVYHRHFQRFIGTQVDLLEIGIFSGGSLGMWQNYLGAGCHVYGVDIDEKCRQYADDKITVFIGDQEDRNFWKSFRRQVPGVDLIIDDGGHTPRQQQVTLEEMLPCLRPGGVFICEDIHGLGNQFTAFVTGLVDELNAMTITGRGAALQSSVTSFQSHIHSVHFYPYITVIEKRAVPLTELRAPKHGSEW